MPVANIKAGVIPVPCSLPWPTPLLRNHAAKAAFALSATLYPRFGQENDAGEKFWLKKLDFPSAPPVPLPYSILSTLIYA
jgi:hypothetical protein